VVSGVSSWSADALRGQRGEVWWVWAGCENFSRKATQLTRLTAHRDHDNEVRQSEANKLQEGYWI
jgi:hypothetical protein